MAMADTDGEMKWQRGYFRMSTTEGDRVVNGDFVYERWGVSKIKFDELVFWNLTHMPTGLGMMFTTEKGDAMLAAKLCEGIAGFGRITTKAEAQPYRQAFIDVLEKEGLHWHGGRHFERWTAV